MYRRITNKISRKNQRGAAMVEFALILWLFVVLVFGMCDFGMWFWQYHALSEVAREAARLGAVTDDSAEVSAKIDTLAEDFGLDKNYVTKATVLDVPAGQDVIITLGYPHDSIIGGLLPSAILPNPMSATIKMRRE